MANLNGVPPRRKDEKDFDKEVRSEYLLPFLFLLASRLSALSAGSSISQIIQAAEVAVEDWIRSGKEGDLESVAIRWANRVNAYHEAKFAQDFIRVAKVDVRPFIQNVDLRIKQRVDASVSLIKTVPERALDDLSKKLLEGEIDSPMDLRAREQVVRGYFDETAKGAAYNIRRITRDQSNKLTGDMTKIRQEALGIKQYRWRTSQDDRVRPTHSTKNGMIYQWGMPPADTGHPGNDIQCRCVAIAHITIDDIRQRVGS